MVVISLAGPHLPWCSDLGDYHHPSSLLHTLGGYLKVAAYIGQTAHSQLATTIPLPSKVTLREKLIKIGARLVRHARRLVLQMAGVTVTRDVFAQLLSRIRLLSPG